MVFNLAVWGGLAALFLILLYAFVVGPVIGLVRGKHRPPPP